MSPEALPIAKKFGTLEAAAEEIVALQERVAQLEADVEYRDEKLKLFQRYIHS